ncbi:MAG: glycosyltransferase family 39 protein [candidate division WWE3 bacterium]|nr:glycosyltransferase family 39 protein [candidate division WWE3 bacterium]
MTFRLKLTNQVYLGTVSVIIIIGGLLRILNLQQRTFFGYDLALINIFAYKFIVLHEKIVTGHFIGGVLATFPPTFYYIATILLKITNYSYYILPLSTIALNILTLIIIAVFLPKLFGKLATLITIFLYSVSAIVVYYTLVGTNPEYIPPLLVISIIGTVFYLKDRRIWWLPIVAFSLALATHFHATIFFAIPGVVLAFIIYRKQIRLDKPGIIAIAISLLILVVVGFVPHYLENKYMGNRNISYIIKALTQGMEGPNISKQDSIANFLESTIQTNGELLIPSPEIYLHPNPPISQSTTLPPIKILGIAMSLFLLFVLIKNLLFLNKGPCGKTIVTTIFIVYFILQAIIPKYEASPWMKPLQWLDAVYFPLYFILLGAELSELIQTIRQRRPRVLIASAITTIVILLVFNIQKWVENTNRTEIPKLQTMIAISRTVEAESKWDHNPFIYSGKGGAVWVWNFNFILWKETGDTKYLRQFIWADAKPFRNEPIYIVSGDFSNLNYLLAGQEDYAKGFQDRPIIKKLGKVHGYFVEKVYNQI